MGDPDPLELVPFRVNVLLSSEGCDGGKSTLLAGIAYLMRNIKVLKIFLWNNISVQIIVFRIFTSYFIENQYPCIKFKCNTFTAHYCLVANTQFNLSSLKDVISVLSITVAGTAGFR